jgi:hypothetical protein
VNELGKFIGNVIASFIVLAYVAFGIWAGVAMVESFFTPEYSWIWPTIRFLLVVAVAYAFSEASI